MKRINIPFIPLIILVLTIVYFLMRLTNLTTLPIFTDEAIYIRWSQIAEQDASWRFISLTDGKQPLLIWFTMISLKIFHDPLFAGRIVSVFAGFFGMLGIGLLGREVFKSTKIGIFSSFLYLISPFTLMYDRMALMDTMVAAFSVWSLYVAILLVRYLRLDVAFILGLLLGGGVLTKTSGFLSIYLLPAALLVFDFNNKHFKKKLLKWLGLSVVAVFFSQLYYSILRLSPWFHMIAQKDGTFIHTVDEQGLQLYGSTFFEKIWIYVYKLIALLEYSSRFFIGNLHGLSDWTIGYLTIPVVVLVFISLLFIYKNWREKVLLVIWFSVPFTALAFFGKVLYPRFILFMVMPLFILASWSIRFLLKRLSFNQIYVGLLLLVIGVYPLFVDMKIFFSIVTAPIPKADSGQYINDHPAGWGIRESVDFLENEAKDKKITVFTEGTFGLLPYGLEIYLVNNPNIEIVGLWPVPEVMSEKMLESIAHKPTYYISNKFQKLPAEWQGTLLAQYPKGNNLDSALRLYKLIGPTIHP